MLPYKLEGNIVVTVVFAVYYFSISWNPVWKTGMEMSKYKLKLFCIDQGTRMALMKATCPLLAGLTSVDECSLCTPWA